MPAIKMASHYSSDNSSLIFNGFAATLAACTILLFNPTFVSNSLAISEVLHVEKIEHLIPERLIEAPIIYTDNVPTVALNAGILDLTLAATLTEVVEGKQRKRSVVVADIKMPRATAVALYDMLGKIILASAPTVGRQN